MKKNVKLLSLILGTACLILSCTQNEGNDKVVEPENTVNIPAYSSGKVLKNKVVSTGSDVYYEYLTFESETGGTYALYKDGHKLLLIRIKMVKMLMFHLHLLTMLLLENSAQKMFLPICSMRKKMEKKFL